LEEGQKMTDAAQAKTPPYPTLNFPTVFVDQVVSLFRGSGIVRFYFARSDPDISASALPNQLPICQVIMPIGGFAAMAVFFQQQLELMMQKEEIAREFVDQLRETVAAQAMQTPQMPPDAGAA
jgi:hypothetical protein